jgi:hypothetical protein
MVIDHSNWDWYNERVPETFAGVAKQKIFFAHASVGANILHGLVDLRQADAVKYPLIPVKAESDPPEATSQGTIYECARGNPSWTEKISGFKASIESGWQAARVDVVMNKLCYIDQAAEWKAYCESIGALEVEFPGTKFVYWTMPITTSNNSNEVLRSRYNQNLRAWIADQTNKILFDIADIESWSPAGRRQTFTSKNVSHDKLFSGYSQDGGHLNAVGRVRAAIAIYSLLGKIFENSGKTA